MRYLRFCLFVTVILLLAACQSTAEPTLTLAPTAEALPTPTTAVAEPTEAAATEAPTTEAPTAEPTVAPAEPTAEAPTVEPTAAAPATVFCPEIARPALILALTDGTYVAADPDSGESCELPLPVPPLNTLQVAGEQIYYEAADSDNMVIQRLSPDGTVEPLPFTAQDSFSRTFRVFTVSPDGKYIFWGYAGAKPDDPSMSMSEGWVAETATGQITAELLDFSQADEGPHALTGVRFSDDGSIFYYARQPIGIGGAWMSFFGRYDSLFSTPSTGGAVTTHFNCAEQELFMCIGDFYLVNGQLANIAYTDDKTGTVVVLTGDGQSINTLTSEDDYIGYPTFSPTAEMIYYTAGLSDESPLPTAASVYRVAPPNAPSELVISDPAIMIPNSFLDDSRLIVGYTAPDQTFGYAIVDLVDGTLEPLSEWPMATVVGVLP